MKRLSVLFAFALITSLTAIGVTAEKAGEKSFKADLSPSGEISTPITDSSATGSATFEMSHAGSYPGGGGGGNNPGPGPSGPVGESYPGIVENPRERSGQAPGGGAVGTEVLKYMLKVDKINDVTAAHLHLGKTSTADGPVIAPLFVGAKKSGEYSGKLAEGVITARDLKGPLAGKTIDDLIKEMKAGNVYVNVHTVKHPAGEIRGEVTPG